MKTKTEIIGMCPGCFDNGKGPSVEIFVERKENGDLARIYIFGDDDFDMPSKNCEVTEVKYSKNGDAVTEITCPRCKENVKVNIPIIAQPSKQSVQGKQVVNRDNVRFLER